MFCFHVDIFIVDCLRRLACFNFFLSNCFFTFGCFSRARQCFLTVSFFSQADEDLKDDSEAVDPLKEATHHSKLEPKSLKVSCWNWVLIG